MRRGSAAAALVAALALVAAAPIEEEKSEMQCPRCKQPNSRRFKFCEGCKAPLKPAFPAPKR
jgi:hypothetical protein